MLPRIYGTTASTLWPELLGPAAWQATPSWTVYRLVCHWLLPWLRVTFAMVPDATWPGLDQRPWGTAPAPGPVGWLGRPSALDPWGVVFCCPFLGRRRCAGVCGVLGHLAPVHRCARSVCCAACALPPATWLLFTSVPAWCVVSRVRCPGAPGSCSPVCPLGALSCVCGVLGHVAPLHLCARSVHCVACAVSPATWLLFTGVPARCVALFVRCPRPLGPFFAGVIAPCVVLRVRFPGPLGSCSTVCPLVALSCVCSVLGHVAPVHRGAHSVRCVACAVSWATWLLFTVVRPLCGALRV